MTGHPSRVGTRRRWHRERKVGPSSAASNTTCSAGVAREDQRDTGVLVGDSGGQPSRVLDQDVPPGPVVLLGHSMGGVVGALFAIDRPLGVMLRPLHAELNLWGWTTRDEATAELRFDIDLLANRLVLATDWALASPHTKGIPIGYFGSSTGAASRSGPNMNSSSRAVARGSSG